MKITYVHQYFKTPKEPGATRIYFIAKRLAEAGHEIRVITQKKGAEKKREVLEVDGLTVVYLRNMYSNDMSIPARIKSFLNFMYKSSFEVFRGPKPDLVIATSTPLSVGLPALLRKWFGKVPFLFEVRDLWPEVPIQMGGLKNPAIRKIAIYFERLIYKNATKIVALSPGMQDGVLKYESAEKVEMIPNMAKKEHFYPRPKDANVSKRLGLRPDSFKVIHFGTMGIANGLMHIMEIAKLMKGEQDVDFVFLGEGKMWDKLHAFKDDHNLNNVHFFSRVPMKETSEILNEADISFVSFLDLPILYTNSPNKLFDSLAGGKPIIVNSNGWTRKMVEDYKCGYYTNPNIPEEGRELILKMKSDPAELSRMGGNARSTAENVFDQSILTEKFLNVVESIEL